MDALADLRSVVPWYLASFSALDRYFHQTVEPVRHVAVDGDVISLAKCIPGLEFPGLPHADAATWDNGTRVYFTCLDSPRRPRRQTYRVLNFLYDPETDRYIDPYGDYRALRESVLRSTNEPYDPVTRLTDAAIAISRYPHKLDPGSLEPADGFPVLEPETQRFILSAILTGSSPWEGLALLRNAGFIDHYWPELGPLAGTEHSKEHHPEGDVWTHTLETFRYRRSRDLVLTLSLLLHDSGKPAAPTTATRKFDGHAEIGAKIASRLLRRLEFADSVVEDVRWLVHKHMFPSALHVLPSFRTNRLMADPLFPVLLELYRCDLESSYRGPDPYYRACRVYRAYLKNSANPFRDLDGKKLVRLYVD